MKHQSTSTGEKVTAPTSQQGETNNALNNALEVCSDAPQAPKLNTKRSKKPVEIGGPKGLEPTRYGDWEAKGRCYDF